MQPQSQTGTPSTLNFATAPLSEIQAAVLADGVVDANEVNQIRQRVFADGQIDQPEAEFIFAINDGVSGNANSPRWDALFVEVLAAFVLEDDSTPGVVDETEGTFIVNGIQGDGQLDTNEKVLLQTIQTRATKIDSPTLNNYISQNSL